MSEKIETRHDVVIEGNFAKFQINMLGAVNGLYTGTFTFRCIMTPSQQIAANRDYREMLGGNATLADERISFMAYALSELKQRITSAPPFWTSTESGITGDIPDEDVLTAILDAAIHAQLQFRKELGEKKLSLLKRAVEQAERMVNGKSDKDDELEEDEE